MKVLPALMASLMGTTWAQQGIANPMGVQLSSPPQTQTSMTQPQASHVRIQVLETKLGLKIWFVHTPNIPVISAAIAFKNAGVASDPKGKSGLTMLLAELLQEGVGEMPATAYKKYLLEKNITMTIGASSDTFNIAFRSVKENAQDVFDLLKQTLTQPRFDPDAQNRAKQQILTELMQATHSENAIASDQFNQQAFPNHPYGKSLRATISELPQITVDDFKKFMADRLGRDQLVLSIAGDIDPETLKELVDKTFQPLAEKATPIDVGFVDPVCDGTVKVISMDIPQSAIIFYQPGLSRQDPDFYAAYLLSKIVGDGEFHSRLWDEVREKRGLTYGIGMDLLWHKNTHYLMGHTSTKNQSVQETLNIIKEQWRLVVEKGIREDELKFVKERLMGGYPLGFSSTGRIVALMRSYQLDGLDADFINRRNNLIEKVTLDDVNRVAKKLFQPEKLTFIVVGSPQNLNSSSEQEVSSKQAQELSKTPSSNDR